MTVATEVKQCLASLKGAEASLSNLAIRTQSPESQQILHETMMIVHEVVVDVQKRVTELEREELQYKGF
jgi:hypothetical protein